MTRIVATVILAVVATAIVDAHVAPGAAARPSLVNRPAEPAVCGAGVGRASPVSHVIWIWMENRSASQVIGNPEAPFIDALARSCGLATRYSAITHPSLPNYIAATSGSTHGITDNGPPAKHPLAAVSLFEEAPSAGSFAESMPTPCRLTDAYPYAARHNPETYYTRIRPACRRDNRPLGSLSGGPFATVLRAGTLPAFSFVAPNLCNGGHDCPLATVDSWARKWIPAMTSSRQYRTGSTVVFLVWDEDDRSGNNQVPLIVLSPSTQPGTRSATPFTHYSLLRTTEELLGIQGHLGRAASAPSMRTAFGL